MIGEEEVGFVVDADDDADEMAASCVERESSLDTSLEGESVVDVVVDVTWEGGKTERGRRKEGRRRDEERSFGTGDDDG